MHIKSFHLDGESRQYLKSRLNLRDDGVFIRRPASGGKNWFGFVFFGMAVIVGALCLLTQSRLTGVVVVQTALCAIGGLWVFIATRRMARSKWHLGDFLFADAERLWKVQGENVEVIDLTNIRDVEGMAERNQFFHIATNLTIHTDDRTHRLRITEETPADELFHYLNALRLLRRGALSDATHLDGKTIGRLAKRIARGETELETLPTEEAEALPAPNRMPHSLPIGQKLGTAWIAAMLLATGAWFGFRWHQEELLFADVKNSPAVDFSEITTYLNTLPDGRRVGQVMDIRDDRRYAIAEKEARETNSPTKLREYLADAENKRHRDEAQQLIAEFYDAAIARLKSLAKDKRVNRDLFNGFLAILESLKTSDSPIVFVGFKGEQVEKPKSVDAALETAAASRVGSSVISPGSVFASGPTEHREQVILQRLQAAVKEVLKADILAFEKAENDAEPSLLVEYRIYSRGRLIRYTSNDTSRNRFGLTPPKERLIGLLRKYHADWTIRIQPPESDKSFVWKKTTSNLGGLTYDKLRSDPRWAPYSVVLYSGFFEMSREIISSFGLTPPKAPMRISHATAMGR